MSDTVSPLVKVLTGEELAAEIKLIQARSCVTMVPGDDVRLLRYARNPIRFDLTGVVVGSVAELPEAPELGALTIMRSPLRSLEGIGRYRRLHKVEIPDTLVTDLRPILELPDLVRLDVRGCPLDRHSYEEVLPELMRRVKVKKRIQFSPREDWELTREMYERGLYFTYSRREAKNTPKLRYPEGPPVTDKPAEDEWLVDPKDLRELLADPELTAKGLWDRLEARWSPEAALLVAKFLNEAIERGRREREEARARWAAWVAAHHEVRWGREAVGRWKDESPTQAWGEALELVLARFPDVPWQRSDEADVARVEANEGCGTSKLPPFPVWYRDALGVCMGPAMWPEDAPVPAGVELDAEGKPKMSSLATVRFGGGWGLSEWVRASPGEYYLHPGARFPPEDVEQVAKWGLLPIGDNVEHVLAIALYDPDDHRIYQFPMSTMWEILLDEDEDEDDVGDDALGELRTYFTGLELPPLDRVTRVRHPEATPVFQNWAEMWFYVESLTYDPVTFKRLPVKKLSAKHRRLYDRLRRS